MSNPHNNLAVIIQNDDGFLLVRQPRPPKFDDPELDTYVDSDLWDLPATQLLERESELSIPIQCENSDVFEKIDLTSFDTYAALQKILGLVGWTVNDVGDWKLSKYVEEPEFGPGLPVNTVFIVGNLLATDATLKESCKWMSVRSCMNLLVKVKPNDDRIGPLVVIGLHDDLLPSTKRKLPIPNYQEYPPGVKILPMQSRTAKPFSTTNLVLFSPENVSDDYCTNKFIAEGDALIVDPGCQPECSEELMNIVAALPRKLIVFATHHHHDHVEGLSAVQKSNPDAILLAHENTLRRIKKGDWSAGTISVSGGDDICINGQQLSIIFAPGHTDGHLGLLHVSTHSLIVGDHCVGQGGALLDIDSGGNMMDYFQTTYNFMELSPHTIIPMHGRLNLWPKYMLSKYIRNLRSREASILAAIEGGAGKLSDIIAKVYPEIDPMVKFAACLNVRVHVEHLSKTEKLPKEFPTQRLSPKSKL